MEDTVRRDVGINLVGGALNLHWSGNRAPAELGAEHALPLFHSTTAATNLPSEPLPIRADLVRRGAGVSTMLS